MTTPPFRSPGDLLARLASESLDDDYAAVARRRATTQPSSPRVRAVVLVSFGLAVAVLAVLVTVSAVRTRDTATAAERDREALIDSISGQQDRLETLRDRVDAIGADVDRLRSDAVQQAQQVASLEGTVEDLQAGTGVVPVTGPGVRITVDDAPSGEPEGQIRDTDLQLLANGLWQAGAQALAVGGQRLTTESAIRSAGQAITVNYRSLSPPYVVTAIGDPDTLPARFLDTSGGQAFADLRANFGVVFQLETPGSLTLPGRPLGNEPAMARPVAGGAGGSPP